MDIAIKIALVASVVLIGYNLHQLVTSYETICEKVKDFKALAKENNSDEGSVRRSNMILTGVLSAVYVALTYLSGMAYWIVAAVLLKLSVSMYMSHLEIAQIFREESIRPDFYRWTKVDAAVNVLMGFGISVVLVL